MRPAAFGAVAESDIFIALDLDTGAIGERPRIVRRLSDLRGAFHDEAAYDAALSRADPVIYETTAVEPASGDGQLHYGLGIIHPGKIGDEYHLTRGHLHAYRPAAEVYVGLKGDGVMLLEDEATGESRIVPLRASAIVYVPGHAAHRTINTGSDPLVYLGVYPANAGYDYATITAQNFRTIVVEENGAPVMKARTYR